jgi:lysyl-tRNA synthetase class 2
MSENWRPGVNKATLHLRAEMLGKIRAFMQVRDILEVDTPVLSLAGTPDPNINSISANLSIKGESLPYYLQTSPEFCMKRLLADDSGAIYQITKVFRDEEIGALHQPEFSILEWYRPGFDHHSLMDEVAELLIELGLGEPKRCSYESAFLRYLDINPHSADISVLRSKASDLGLQQTSNQRSLLLDFLFSHSVSPHLGIDRALLLYDYPACQAALARLTNDKPVRAERFELFISGIELANGFHELKDVQEQRERFEEENNIRQRSGLETVVIDEALLSALEFGLPDCAGVAIGLDRLLMVMAEKSQINDVMTFPL